MPTKQERIYTISLNEDQVTELEGFLRSADDGESIIKVIREQIGSQRPVAHHNIARSSAVSALRKTAEDYRSRALKYTDTELQAECRSDADDLDEIADAVEAGDDGRAKRRTRSLDPAVRDEIPYEANLYCGLRSRW